MDDQLDATFVPMAAVDEISGTIENPKIKALGELRKGFTPFIEDDVIFAKNHAVYAERQIGRSTRALERSWVRID